MNRCQSHASFIGVAGIILVLLPNAARADFSKTITVTPGVQTQAVATWYFANCTTILGVGSYSITVAPNHGIVTFGGVNGVIPGCPSGSPSLPALAAYYTWVDTTPGGSSDSFQLTYSVNGLSELIDITVNTTEPIPPPAAPTPQPGCEINVSPIPVTDNARSLIPTLMTATFSTPMSMSLETGEDLIAYAHRCGFESFDWQQVITYLPSTSTRPSPFKPTNRALINPFNLGPFGTIKAPPDISDPAPGGWTYIPINSYPFYRYVYPDPWFQPGCRCALTGGAAVDAYGCTAGVCPRLSTPPNVVPYQVSSDGTTLGFADAPSDSSLPGDPPSVNPRDGAYIAFRTSLVGVSSSPSAGASSCDTHDKDGNTVEPLYCTPLYVWTWNTTFNGCSGPGDLEHYFPSFCNEGGVSQTVGDYLTLPGTGTGGVTITSINGVQLPSVLLPSQVSVTASGLAFSRLTQTFDGTLTISNISTSPINGPLQVLLTGLPEAATLVNATGSFSGTPYLTVPADAGVAPGESILVSVKFKNALPTPITFLPVAYSGSIN